MRKKCKNILIEDSGATGIEYGMIGALIGTALIGSLVATGGNMSSTFLQAKNVIAFGPDGNALGEAGQFEEDDATEVIARSDAWVQTKALDGWDFNYTGNFDHFAVSKLGYLGGGVWAEGSSRGWDEGGVVGLKSGTSLSREIDNLSPGEELTLSFDTHSDDRTGNSKLRVSFGGEIVGEFSGNAEFTRADINIVAGQGNGSNELVFEEVGSTGWAGSNFKDISVVSSNTVRNF